MTSSPDPYDIPGAPSGIVQVTPTPVMAYPVGSGSKGGEHMNDSRTHDVTTTDGVTIAGSVHGQGPPLVFLHGAIGDGDLDWQAVVDHLTGRFACHLPSSRGRGLSGDSPDLSFGRRVDDVLAYLDSIEEPTGLVGWSAGGAVALAAAARSDAVNAVAVYEPVMDSLMDAEEKAAIGGAIARMGEAVPDGRLTDAMRAFAGFVCQEGELAMLDDAGYLEASEHYAPNLLRTFQQPPRDDGASAPVPPSAADPVVLGAISAPLLVLHGTDTKSFWIRFAQHVATHVPNARVGQVPGAGHAAPLTHPEVLAGALGDFFTSGRENT